MPRRRLSRQAHRLRNNPGQLGDVRVAGSLLAPMPAARLCIAVAYDGDGLRQFLSERGTQPVIPNDPTRKRLHPFDADISQRNLIERMFCRLKDWRRIATRYDKLAANFAAAVAIATIVLWSTWVRNSGTSGGLLSIPEELLAILHPNEGAIPRPIRLAFPASTSRYHATADQESFRCAPQLSAQTRGGDPRTRPLRPDSFSATCEHQAR